MDSKSTVERQTRHYWEFASMVNLCVREWRKEDKSTLLQWNRYTLELHYRRCISSMGTIQFTQIACRWHVIRKRLHTCLSHKKGFVFWMHLAIPTKSSRHLPRVGSERAHPQYECLLSISLCLWACSCTDGWRAPVPVESHSSASEHQPGFTSCLTWAHPPQNFVPIQNADINYVEAVHVSNKIFDELLFM